jgi:hypothetical protein
LRALHGGDVLDTGARRTSITDDFRCNEIRRPGSAVPKAAKRSTEICDYHACTLHRAASRNGAANPAPGARDDDHLAAQCSHRAAPPCLLAKPMTRARGEVRTDDDGIDGRICWANGPMS